MSRPPYKKSTPLAITIKIVLTILLLALVSLFIWVNFYRESFLTIYSTAHWRSICEKVNSGKVTEAKLSGYKYDKEHEIIIDTFPVGEELSVSDGRIGELVTPEGRVEIKFSNGSKVILYYFGQNYFSVPFLDSSYTIRSDDLYQQIKPIYDARWNELLEP